MNFVQKMRVSMGLLPDLAPGETVGPTFSQMLRQMTPEQRAEIRQQRPNMLGEEIWEKLIENDRDAAESNNDAKQAEESKPEMNDGQKEI